MTVTAEVRTAVPELDALTNIGHAAQHTHNHDTIAAINYATAIVSDRARAAGATNEDVFDCYSIGFRGHTHLAAERDEQLVIAHLALALVYINDTHMDAMLAVAKAVGIAASADQAAAPLAA